MGHDGLEPSANGLRGEQGAAQSEGLRGVAACEGIDGAERAPACFTVRQNDSSRNVTEKGAERTSAPIASNAARIDAAADVETALARALDAAAAVGRFDVVAQLARELEGRRLAGAANVVALDAKTRRRGA